MYRSKATATEAEAAEIVRRHGQAQATPAFAVGGGHAAAGGFAADARRAFISHINGVARAHGLEDQAGEWGFDPTTRQFMSAYPIVERELTADEKEAFGVE